MSYLKEQDDSLVLLTYVQPGAKKTHFQELFDGRLKIRISAPPVEGRANKELIKFLSKSFGISKSKIKIIRGDQSRKKDLELKGIKKKELELSLQALLQSH